MAIIYLSSTYEDLKDYRRVVFDALRQSGYQVFAMEDYVAADQRPVDKCLKDVEKADIYVGLFAFRYGYIPPASHNNPNGLSITELEFQRAVALNKSCLTFVVKDTTPWSRTYDDAYVSEDKGERIKVLRQHLLAEKIASAFESPHELATLVLTAVKKHLDGKKLAEAPVSEVSANPTVISWDIEKNGSPYPGLMRFTRKYAPVYFGRDAEIRDILDRFRLPEGRFLIISGASGTGKSSLVDAGVLPKLEMTGITENHAYQCVRMAPSQGRHPFDALMRSLQGYAEQAGMDAYTLSEQLLRQPDDLSQCLQDIVSKCFKTGEFVLFLDQMEELLTECDRLQSHAFLTALYRAVHETRVRVIATIRSDFLHYCHEQVDLLRLLNGRGHIALGPIDAGSIRDMILKPAQCAGLSLSEQFVRRLTREAGQEPGNLPLLAFALRQLFDKGEEKELTEQAYDDMGGLVGAIGQQVDQVMAGLGEETRGAFDSVFAELVHVERECPPTKRRIPLTVFQTANDSTRLIEALAGSKCRILVTGEQAQEPMVEVAHEKLFTAWPKLKNWIDGSGEALRLIDYAEEAARRWHDLGGHLRELWWHERVQPIQQALLRFNKTPSPALEALLRPQQMLIERLNHETLSHQDRLLIGQKLAEFGDPRSGVGLRPDGLPDIEWVVIPQGRIQLEGIDHVFEVKRFRIAKYLVTNAQFEAFIKAEDCYRNEKWWKDMEPSKEASVASWHEANSSRETVFWFEAVAFCRWFSHRTGSKVRLPTEWEWQQAATGGDPTREYPWHGKWDVARCNSIESRLSRTTAVGMYPRGATQQGLLDMAGNVWEWCLNTYEQPETPESLRIDELNTRRVVRGGCWFNEPENLRVSNRYRRVADYRNAGLGFRLAQDIP
ncbi:MAG: SUMF1/EgtB/PvdO family nonheme iron enzyme [Nitrospira sp.]|nr:SUMF1/EgtB/PvdO family nonheme iron enzyme [Nitrospira sp.]